jgi:catechol 2,3-dioxygenase-like lactoylglutathione lyase family enzyme
MINGVHLLLNSRDPEADRAFLRDVLGWPFVDAGHGWLIFALPPTELAVHPSDAKPVEQEAGHGLVSAVVYLLCDNLHSTVESLGAKGVVCTAIEEARWGVTTTFPLPGGGSLGLYEPHHPLAITPSAA